MRRRDHHDGPGAGAQISGATVLVGLLLAAGPALTATVSSIAWDRHPSGLTALTVTCSAPLDEGAFRSYRVSDPPRIVVVVEGISEVVEPGVLSVGNGFVDRVRLGLHRDRRPPELHVVFDLASEHVELRGLRAVGADLVALVGPRPAPDESQPDDPPTRTPTPTPTPPVPSPPPKLGDPPDRPLHPTIPPVASRPPEPVTAATDDPYIDPRNVSPVTSPTAAAEAEAGTRVVDITASARNDDSTLLLITADGRLPRGCSRVMAVSGDPPRLIVNLRGVSAPDLPRSISFDDPNLKQVRLIHDAETGSGELHLVLHPTRKGLAVAEQRQVGPNLVLHLRSGDPHRPEP